MRLFIRANNMSGISDLFKTVGDKRICAVPTRCRTPRHRSMDELMESEWQELVIQFDKEAGEYVFKTACCTGAPAC